ncbi:hypothetical protein HN903_04640 [archaeon]|jgi:hypothetical protein|nr:hypothetical protein [archaeon]MBT7129016.1 hypothetical protein [archaeon]
MVEASVSAIGYFMPIFAFLLVFIVIYALLVKTKVLGESPAVMLFISFILSSFFIVEASLVDFVQFSSAWFGTIVISLFFLIVILAFIPGIKIGEFFGKGNWFAWVLLGVMLLFFIFSSAYVFNWVLNWEMIQGWFDEGWFGMILLLVIAGVVSFVLTKK